jgi:hypothetical protein
MYCMGVLLILPCCGDEEAELNLNQSIFSSVWKFPLSWDGFSSYPTQRTSERLHCQERRTDRQTYRHTLASFFHLTFRKQTETVACAVCSSLLSEPRRSPPSSHEPTTTRDDETGANITAVVYCTVYKYRTRESKQRTRTQKVIIQRSLDQQPQPQT